MESNLNTETYLEVKPEHEACFLYVVPGKATRIEMGRIHVVLKLVLHECHQNLQCWMNVLLGRHFPETSICPNWSYVLLRDGARALMGPGNEQYKELKEAFEMMSLDSTTEGLECIVSVCNILLTCNRHYDEWSR